MSLAAETRAAVRERPFLLEALRAGVVNYAAAARVLELDADEEAVATALRRFASDLPDRAPAARDVQVTMRSGLAETADDPLLRVGDVGFSPEDGSYTAIVARGAVDAAALGEVLGRARAKGLSLAAAGVVTGSLVVVVEGRDGGRALRVVEAALDRVPTDPTV